VCLQTLRGLHQYSRDKVIINWTIGARVELGGQQPQSLGELVVG
jgi:hypothetical protein